MAAGRRQNLCRHFRRVNKKGPAAETQAILRTSRHLPPSRTRDLEPSTFKIPLAVTLLLQLPNDTNAWTRLRTIRIIHIPNSRTETKICPRRAPNLILFDFDTSSTWRNTALNCDHQFNGRRRLVNGSIKRQRNINHRHKPNKKKFSEKFTYFTPASHKLSLIRNLHPNCSKT